MFMEMSWERYHDYPVTQMVSTKYRSEEWELLTKNDFQTVEVYEDGISILIYQKYLH